MSGNSDGMQRAICDARGAHPEWSLAQIGKGVGCTRAYVSTTLQSAGLPTRGTANVALRRGICDGCGATLSLRVTRSDNTTCPKCRRAAVKLARPWVTCGCGCGTKWQVSALRFRRNQERPGYNGRYFVDRKHFSKWLLAETKFGDGWPPGARHVDNSLGVS